MDTVDLSSLELTIDGVSYGSLEDFRVQSNPFPIRLPEDNLFGAPPGTYIGISDGIWVIVEGLPVGEHTIEFGGQADGFTVHVTYHLTVVWATDEAANDDEEALAIDEEVQAEQQPAEEEVNGGDDGDIPDEEEKLGWQQLKEPVSLKGYHHSAKKMKVNREFSPSYLFFF